MLLNIEMADSPVELRQGIAEIKREYAKSFDARAVDIIFERQESLKDGGSSVSDEGHHIVVRYGRRIDAFRALGRLMGAAENKGQKRSFDEKPRFDMLGVMFDVSRNGVLTTAAVSSLLRRLALMGIDTVMLYTEDIYQLPGEPFWGYLRGSYTFAELKSLDDYADALGIEMVPCIQTLAHLEQVLQWPAYEDYRDTGGVLIAEEEKTYSLVEKMIDAASAPLRSRRIHIGMDEAHGIGTGRYRTLHGKKRPFDILNRHLKRVLEICARRNLEPMIWSDMYFRLGSRNNSYYDPEAVIPDDVAASIPSGVDLVYWDYYHTDSAFYSEWISRHRNLGSEPIMAGGVWTWGRFWAALPFSFTVTDACMAACKKEKLRQAFITLWGDGGTECDMFSALPGIQFFAEHGYADRVNPELLKANFRGTCNADFDDWLEASRLDSVPGIDNPASSMSNASRWILWQDPLLSIMDPWIEGLPLRRHYENLETKLAEAARKTESSRRLLFPAHLAKALALKCDLRPNIVQAYCDGDHERLHEILKGDLANLIVAVEELWECHRNMWLSTNKPFGLEVIEGRYGGLYARLKSLSARLKAYLAGDIISIPELEAHLERTGDAAEGDLPYETYERVVTPSNVK